MKMEYTRKLKDPRTLRIFFSSTFKGMEAEREQLTRKYFPQIHHLCNSKGLQFVPVDMRWGITSEASANGQVVNICLHEIDRSDIFVGFSAQRYGWHGNNDELLQQSFNNAVKEYPWIEGHRGKSVTELEFLHGFINSPGILPAIMCFRDKAFDDAAYQKELEENNEMSSSRYKTTSSNYVSESEEASVHLSDLKRRVMASSDKNLGVKVDYESPEVGAKFIFEAILKHLQEVLLAESTDDLSQREVLSLQHNAYLASHLGLYVGGDEYMTYLNTRLEAEMNPVLVTGPAGSGKSSLLSNWLDSLQLNQSDLILIHHFVGKASLSTSGGALLQRLAEEADYHLTAIKEEKKKQEEAKRAEESKNTLETKNEDPDTDNNAETKEDKKPKPSISASTNLDDELSSIKENNEKLMKTLEELVSEKKRVILAIDGLDKMDNKSLIGKRLNWVPVALPKGVFLVLSTLTSDVKNIQELNENRKFDMVEVKPLTSEQKNQLCVRTLEESGKELSREQLQKVLDSPNTSNPLYLKITLSELCMFGYFRLLDEKIDSLISSPGVVELFEKFLTRLEADYNASEHAGNLVEQVMCCILLSKQGMSADELMAMFNIHEQLWSPFYFSMQKFIVVKSNLLKFAFGELEEAISRVYLSSQETKQKYLRSLIDYFQGQRKLLSPEVSLLTSRSVRFGHELPHLWTLLEDKPGLARCLLDPYVFQRMIYESPYELLMLWKSTEHKGTEIANSYIEVYENMVAELHVHRHDNWITDRSCPADKFSDLITDVDQLLDMGRYHAGREIMLRREQSMLENVKGDASFGEDYWDRRYLALQYNLGCVLVDMEKYEAGEEVHKMCLQRRKVKVEEGGKFLKENQSSLANSYHGLGLIYMALDKYDEAIEHYEKSLEIMKGLDKDKDVAIALINMGNIKIKTKEYEKALETFRKAEEIYKKVYFGQEPPAVGELIQNIGLCYRKLNKLDEAEKIYKQAIQIKRNAVGADHPTMSISMMNMGTLMVYRKKYQESLDYNTECIRIYEVNEYPSDTKEFLMAKENVVNAFAKLDRHNEALPYFWDVFRGLNAKGHLHKCLPLIQLMMIEYLISIKQTSEAEEVLLALMDNDVVRRDKQFICLDNMDRALPAEQRPVRPYKYTLERALELWPDSRNILSHFIESSLLLKEDDINTLLRWTEIWDKNVEIDDFNVYESFTEYMADEKKLQVALKMAATGLERYPEHTGITMHLARVYKDLKDYDKALQLAKETLKSQDCNAACYHMAAMVAMEMNDLDLAEGYFKNILELENGTVEGVDYKEQANEGLKTISEASGDTEKKHETAEEIKGNLNENTGITTDAENNNEKTLDNKSDFISSSTDIKFSSPINSVS